MQSVVPPPPLWEPKTREFRKRGYSLQLLFESRSVLIMPYLSYSIENTF